MTRGGQAAVSAVGFRAGRSSRESEEAKRFFYPGTETLKNKAGIRDLKAAEAFERSTSQGRERLRSPMLAFTAEDFRAVHRYLFQDVWVWAGEYRTYTTGRGSAPFARPEYIGAELERRFALLNKENDLKGTRLATFAERVAEHVNEINAIHPFLEGNGRTQRAFLKDLARQAGFALDMERLDPLGWNEASRVGFESSNHRPMQQLLISALTEITPER